MRPKFDINDLKTRKPVDQDIHALGEGGGPWITPENIPVKAFYGRDDLAGMEHLNYAAGIPPFLRGPYSGMYAMQPWTIRQYAGFSTAEESNAFYRRNLAGPCARGYCAANPSPTNRRNRERNMHNNDIALVRGSRIGCL